MSNQPLEIKSDALSEAGTISLIVVILCWDTLQRSRSLGHKRDVPVPLPVTHRHTPHSVISIALITVMTSDFHGAGIEMS